MAETDAGIAIVGGAGALVTEALTWMLTGSGIRVLGAFPDFTSLESVLERGGQRLQAAVVDAEDPAAGPGAVAELRRVHPELKILLLCDAVSSPVIQCAIEQHVQGVVLKSDAAEEMLQALRHVLEGRAVMPAAWHDTSLEPKPLTRLLSAREREVLDHAASGLSNREIAERLVISTNTVKFHLRAIYASLGVRNRVQATRAVSRDEPRRASHTTPGKSGSG